MPSSYLLYIIGFLVQSLLASPVAPIVEKRGPLCPVVPPGGAGSIKGLGPCSETSSGSQIDTTVASDFLWKFPEFNPKPTDSARRSHNEAVTNPLQSPAPTSIEAAAGEPLGPKNRGSPLHDASPTAPVTVAVTLSTPNSPQRTVLETYVPTTFTGALATLAGTSTVSTLYTDGGRSTLVPMVVFSSGRGYALPQVDTDMPIPGPLPPIGVPTPPKPGPGNNPKPGIHRNDDDDDQDKEDSNQDHHEDDDKNQNDHRNNDDDDHNDDRDKDNDEKNDTDDNDRDSEDNKQDQTEEHGKDDHTSTTQSCTSRAMATACTVSITNVTTTIDAKATTSTSTVSTICGPTTGCFVSDSTTTTTASSESTPTSTAVYWIFPNQPTDAAKNDEVQEIILGLADVDKERVTISGSSDEPTGMICWDAPLNDTGRAVISQTPGVGFLIEDCGDDCPPDLKPDLDDDEGFLSVPDLRVHDEQDNATSVSLAKRDSGFTAQMDAGDELAFLSAYNRRNWAISDYDKRFVYDQSAGQESLVYLVDSGADIRTNNNFSEIRSSAGDPRGKASRIRWAGPNYNRAPGAVDIPAPEFRDFGANHGTKMLSKILGRKYGVAKNTNVVVASVGPRNLRNTLAALNWVLRDWRLRQQRGHNFHKVAVLSFSLSIPKPLDYQAVDNDLTLINRLRGLFREAIANGILPVVSTGNAGRTEKQITSYPARFATNWDHETGRETGNAAPILPGLLPVGPVDNDGKFTDAAQRWINPPHDWAYVTAPGKDVRVAGTFSSRTDVAASGSSVATATVAGVAAYILSLPSYRTGRGWTENAPQSAERVQNIFDDLQDPLKYVFARRENDADYPLAIWNGVQRRDWARSCRGANGGYAPKKARRADDDSSHQACAIAQGPDNASSTDIETQPAPTTEASPPPPDPTPTTSDFPTKPIFIRQFFSGTEDTTGSNTTVDDWTSGFGVPSDICTAHPLYTISSVDAEHASSNPGENYHKLGPFDVDKTTSTGVSCFWEGQWRISKAGTHDPGKMSCGMDGKPWTCGASPVEKVNCEGTGNFRSWSRCDPPPRDDPAPPPPNDGPPPSDPPPRSDEDKAKEEARKHPTFIAAPKI